MARVSLRSVVSGVEKLSGDRDRHYHREAYATIVLAGRFTEASFFGRSEVGPGDVLLHSAFDAHANLVGGSRAITILRLPWFAVGPEGLFRCNDPDELVRLAESDPNQARDRLADNSAPVTPDQTGWTDRLANDLGAGGVEKLSDWAEENRLSPETVARGFGRAFGVAPRLFRLETRTRAAWRAIVGRQETLTSIAHRFGFADLPHMSRNVRLLTGFAPSAWRSNVSPDQVGSSVTSARVASP